MVLQLYNSFNIYDDSWCCRGYRLLKYPSAPANWLHNFTINILLVFISATVCLRVCKCQQWCMREQVECTNEKENKLHKERMCKRKITVAEKFSRALSFHFRWFFALLLSLSLHSLLSVFACRLLMMFVWRVCSVARLVYVFHAKCIKQLMAQCG